MNANGTMQAAIKDFAEGLLKTSDDMDRVTASNIDELQRRLSAAALSRVERMADVRRKRQEAAELIAESIRDEEEIEAEQQTAMTEIHAAIAEVRPKRIAAAPTMKAIRGGKAAE